MDIPRNILVPPLVDMYALGLLLPAMLLCIMGKLERHRRRKQPSPGFNVSISLSAYLLFFAQTKNHLKRWDHFFPQILAFLSPLSGVILWNAHENREMVTRSMINHSKLLLQLLIRVVDVSYLLFFLKRSKTFIILKRWKSWVFCVFFY